MNFTTDEVRYVADLANLRLSEEETNRLSTELGQILTYIEQLNELNTENVAPMSQVLFEADETATLREDRPQESLSNEAAVANSAISGQGYFKVPRAIER